MRSRPLLGAVLAAALLLTGCASGESTPSESGSSASSITVTDNQDREFSFDEAPDRLVVINSYNVELVTALIGFDHIVGTDQASIDRITYEDFSGVEPVGQDLSSLNYEAIAGLEPDAVLIPENGVWEDASEQLEAFGIPVIVLTGWQATQWEWNLDLLGTLFDASDRAAQALDFTNELNDLVEERVADVDVVRGYWEDDDFHTAGPESQNSALLPIAGIDSISADAELGTENEVDPAFVLEADPQIVLREVTSSYTPTTQEDFETLAAQIEARAGWDGLAAEQSGDIILFNSWPLYIAGWNFAPLYYASWAHPEAFADVDIASYVQEYASEFLGIDYDGDASYIYRVGDHR